MSTRFTQFSKFILKKIVRGVAISDSPDLSSVNIYKFLKVELNDELLREIFEEGSKYNLSTDECLAQIRLADDKINTNPSITRSTTTVRISDFKLGDRLDLVYHNEHVGRIKVSVLAAEHNNFVVISSDIGDIEYRDILLPLHRRLNSGYPSYFDVYRDGELLTGDELKFSPGRLEYIESHRPGLVYDILDADKTFAYVQEQPKAGGKKQERKEAENEYYVTFPASTSYPPTWGVKELSLIDGVKAAASAPFIIRLNDSTHAALYANSKFRFNKGTNIFKYERTQISTICEVVGDITQNTILLTTLSGRLEYDKLSHKWVLKEKPKVTVLRLPDEKIFKILKTAIWNVKKRDISFEDLDSNLVALSVYIPDLADIILQLEELAKVEIDHAGINEISTVRDLYELLSNAKRKKDGK